jgi:hypothetical protein
MLAINNKIMYYIHNYGGCMGCKKKGGGGKKK